MMNTLMIFEGNEIEVTKGQNGEPLFELYSTGAALGYSRWTKSKGKDYFKIEKSRIDKIVTNAEISTLAHDGQTFLTEDMLYDFMLEAKTEKCRKFRKWVIQEVLPSIRKNGGYVNDADKFVSKMFPKFDGQDRDAIITMFKENMEKAQEVFKKQEAILIEQQKEVIQSKEKLQQATLIINQAYAYKNQAENYMKEQDKRMKELLVEKEKRFYIKCK